MARSKRSLSRLLVVAILVAIIAIGVGDYRQVDGGKLRMQKKGVTASDWESWLAQWNQELLDRIDPTELDMLSEEGITDEVVSSGWLGYPGATEDQITRLEARLGKTLPPSYRAFLKVSNGFRQPGMLVWRLLPAEEVEWFRVRNQETIDIWKGQEELPDALEISAQEIAGSAFYLLNPKVVNADGEWEALYFASWVPGCHRYSSFRELMQKEYHYSVFYAERGKGQMRSGDDTRMIVIKYPNLVKDLERKIHTLNDKQYPSNVNWRTDVLKILEMVKSRAIEIREKNRQPEEIHRQLTALLEELRNKVREKWQARAAASSYSSTDKDGIEDGYWITIASVNDFLNIGGLHK
jgi:hypothetical protein